jgi:RNA polymerase sigma-70 factor, ECF subfamily
MSPAEEDALCRELVPRVRAFALRRTGKPALAADVAQQVAMIVLESLRAGRVEDPARLGAFVLGVAKKVLGAIHSGEQRRSALLEQYGPTLEEVATLEEHGVDRRKIGECFGKLAARAQTVLSLTFYADRSAEEIGAELGLATGNVRVMRHRALTQLHECLGGTR